MLAIVVRCAGFGPMVVDCWVGLKESESGKIMNRLDCTLAIDFVTENEQNGRQIDKIEDSLSLLNWLCLRGLQVKIGWANRGDFGGILKRRV